MKKYRILLAYSAGIKEISISAEVFSYTANSFKFTTDKELVAIFPRKNVAGILRPDAESHTDMNIGVAATSLD